MRMVIAVAALTLVSCSPVATPSGADLASETAGRVAGPARSCIHSSSADNLRPLDQRALAFGSGQTVYVNHFAQPCTAMSPTAALIVEPAIGGQYCSGDRIRPLEPGSTIAGPYCVLGDWIPYHRP